ncbi:MULTISPECIES: nickel-responsive transcriptional regulator NikR [Thermococcus]|jgi:CopG family nickel-responsive transcriptional regulator|uniref:Putative nickel-responsive regulator n=2 Tax=Thermococcus TaxID=2263 RepID=A0A097QTN8_9EURY|nr:MULTISPECIES: nickel-responsive transcriptional regulator NikR [Thermococcus]AHL23844.1 putative transcriptional regulators containing the CopG/Arc/MetJ DNA-binding domain and a metal-binding domain [Thermococcus nautili]AIU69851.1 nickel-responsive regulator [Thermococcus eurythermalis]NJE49106.1 nickel-responsive transcriptional regulator NikR [Thermococcus sp. 9N3]CAI1492080.1 Putative nickel-responsive regulator [Thermococcus nautili]
MKVVRFGVSVPEELLEKFDRIIEEKGYVNRSEAIRDLMRDFIIRHEWETGDAEVAGTITMLYNHDEADVVKELLDLQHDYLDEIVSSIHVHMDEHNCLEVVIVKGKASRIKEIADRLLSLKGVKHGKLVMTGTGKELV